MEENKLKKWCPYCQCFVEFANMKRWSNDDETISYLCDGCDYEFTELRESNEDRDDYRHSQ